MKKLISLGLILCLLLSCTLIMPASTAAAAGAEGKQTVTTVNASPLINELMEEYTTFVVVKQKQLGGSHYAYTEALSDELNNPGFPDGGEAVFHPGSQLVLLELAKSGDKITRTETVLLDSTDGVIRDPDVSADGTTVLFSWKKSRNDDYHLYEYDLKTKQTTQLTFGSGIADTEPKYLANGQIVFSSTRIIQTVDCWITPVSNIFLCDADGGNITRLGYDQVHTTYPTVTSDGRVLYTRWDYNDRNQMYIQGVFQMFPDGTNQTELYGNDSNFPTTLLHTREIPGTTDKYISIASGHHVLQAGKLVVLDTSVGRNNKDSVEFVVKDGSSSKNDSIDGYGQSGALYKYPYAINEDLFMCAYTPSGWASNKYNTAFSIYLFDMNGNKAELVPGTESLPASQIVPVAIRTLFERASLIDYAKDTGNYYIGNIYEGDGLKGVEVGEAKYLRVVALDYRSYAIGATVASGTGSADPYSPVSTGNGAWDVKRVLGIATIEEDGSALFAVPSETPVYFQVLNADGDVIQSMRSWSTLMPGENFSCVGCHEDKNTVPPVNSSVTMAMTRNVEELQPDFWQTGEGYEDFNPYTTTKGFDYLEEIQPIWDESCVECHSNVGDAYDAINITGMAAADSTVGSTALPLETEWKYTTERQSGSDWYKADFDDSAWSTGKAPFGLGTSGPGNANTTWDSDRIYMRTEFNINQYQLEDLVLSMDLACVMFPSIYINGVRVYNSREELTEYTTIEFTEQMRAALKQGKNTIAVSAVKSELSGNFVGLSIKGVLPDSDSDVEVVSTGARWKYRMSRTNDVANGWNTVDFDDSSWSVSQAPFGDRENYKTSWTGDNKYIWIRQTFTIDDLSEFENCSIELNTWYDDNPLFYLNGHLIFRDTEGNPWVDAFTKINLGTAASEYLVQGTNVFAIQCSNDTGGRQIDSSMTLIKNTKKTVELLPDRAEGWKYVINDTPASNWMNEGFNDSTWSTGRAPFGSNGNCNTSWRGDNSDIWLRNTFTVDNLDEIKDMKMYLKIFYDEDPTVYINGTEVFSASGYLTSYKTVGLSLEDTALLKQGVNTIAVHAHNSSGGLFIDVGLKMQEVGGAPISLESTDIIGTRMKKYFPLSYLVLTGSTPNGTNWVGSSTNNYTNWISSMSQCEMLEPYSYGAFKSNLIKKLRNGHGNLTETQIRKIAAWIDLGVPAYGAYDVNTKWGGNEVRWAEQYTNKRAFYTTMNEYARMARAAGGTVQGEELSISYAATNGKSYSVKAAGLATLNIDKAYTAGDTVTIKLPEGQKYLMVCLNAMMGEELVYVPDGTFTYKIPSGMNAYVPTFGSAINNTITARLPKAEELTEHRNLAENVYDLDGSATAYPHATASSAHGNQSEFQARNAIDGFTANTGHGNYPYQSWGPNHESGYSWMQVDFGREVYVDEVELYIRADFPHDVHYTSATLEFSDGTEMNIPMTRTSEGQVYTFDTIKTSYVKIKNLVPADSNTALWSGLMELKAYGYAEEKADDPTCIWTLDKDKEIVYGMNLGTSIEEFKKGFGTDVTVMKNGKEVTSGLVGTGMTVEFLGTTYTAAILCDVEGDGGMTVSDVVELRKLIVAGSSTAAQLKAGDLDNSKTLTVSDVVELRSRIVSGG